MDATADDGAPADAATADLRRAANGVRAANGAYAAAIDDVLLRIENRVLGTRVRDRPGRREEEGRGRRRPGSSTSPRRASTRRSPRRSISPKPAPGSNREDAATVAAAEGVRGGAPQDALRALILPFDRGETADVRLDPPSTTRGRRGRSRSFPPTKRATCARRSRAAPDLLAIDAELENRGIDVRVAENDLLPQVDLFARLGADGLDRGVGTALGEMVTGQAVTAEVGLTFSTTFGRRTARARLRIAEWTCRQAGVRRREAVNRIVEEVRAAVRDAATARARLASATVEIASASESLEGERTKQRNGESTPFLVLQREEERTQAVTREGRAAADARIAEARLWKAIGMLAEMRGATPPSIR